VYSGDLLTVLFGLRDCVDMFLRNVTLFSNYRTRTQKTVFLTAEEFLDVTGIVIRKFFSLITWVNLNLVTGVLLILYCAGYKTTAYCDNDNESNHRLAEVGYPSLYWATDEQLSTSHTLKSGLECSVDRFTPVQHQMSNLCNVPGNRQLNHNSELHKPDQSILRGQQLLRH
jgi:hypothetical protein